MPLLREKVPGTHPERSCEGDGPWSPEGKGSQIGAKAPGKEGVPDPKRKDPKRTIPRCRVPRFAILLVVDELI